NAEPSRLEQVEKLEQLRAIEAGTWIQVVEVDKRAAGIDTQKDFDQFVARISG
ncbi:MAG: 3-deoxy-manno-octulosonate cytidylyltransferase, partial [Planctomycetota bacterium]|nr:3-deoxy-manno-octulosonate cytidylyltransferase [Planctomycetota bacterium]